jgi:hypothetical protein
MGTPPDTSIMTSPTLWNLVLDQDARDGHPIAGRLIGPDGNVVEFRGWLEFAAAVEAARSEQRAEAAAAAPDPPNVARSPE